MTAVGDARKRQQAESATSTVHQRPASPEPPPSATEIANGPQEANLRTRLTALAGSWRQAERDADEYGPNAAYTGNDCAEMLEDSLAATDPAPDEALQCPHEAVRTSCGQPCGCNCGPCASLAPTPPTVAPSDLPVATGDAEGEGEPMDHCDCTTFCEMGPTCPGGWHLPDAGCHRVEMQQHRLIPPTSDSAPPPPWRCSCGKWEDPSGWTAEMNHRAHLAAVAHPAPVHADDTDAGDEGVRLSPEEQDALILALLNPDDDCAHNLAPLFRTIERIIAARLGEGVVEWGVRYPPPHPEPEVGYPVPSESIARSLVEDGTATLVTRTVHTSPWVEVSE